MTVWHVDLTNYTSNEFTEEDVAKIQDSLEAMFAFTKRIKQFIDCDYKIFAISKQFPELSSMDQKTIMFWDRVMADPGLRKHISHRIAEKTGIQGTGTDWAMIEDNIIPENANDIATEEIAGELENWVATSKENTTTDTIKLVLRGSILSNRDYPTRTIELSPNAARIARTIQKESTPIKSICRCLDNPNKIAVRQAIYRFNLRVKGNLMTGGAVILGHSDGTGYRWARGVSLEIKE
jgi:hypothetical protein